MNRRQPLLSCRTETPPKNEKDGGNGRRIGEFAGGATAECAAVCCCCPLGMMHLLILVTYKVPTGLYKKALRKHKKKKLLKRKKKNLLDEDQRTKMQNKSGPDGNIDDDESSNGQDDIGVAVIDAVDLDAEMWDRFYGAGFWRSFSQRED